MRIRTDNQECDHCGNLFDNGETCEETHTRLGYDFCNYECMGDFYCSEIPEEEDFIIVPK
jgi:hypothetical protein